MVMEAAETTEVKRMPVAAVGEKSSAADAARSAVVVVEEEEEDEEQEKECHTGLCGCGGPLRSAAY